MKCEALRGKTPDQIKGLASHYHSRAVKAERERDAMEKENRKLKEHIQRLHAAVYEANVIVEGQP